MFKLFAITYIIASIVAGKVVATKNVTNKQYWLAMTFPIIIFSLMYGLRDGWLIDFNIYEDIYVHRNYIEGKLGWLTYIVFFFGEELGLSYNFILVIFNAFLIVSFCAIIKPYKRYAYWILPLFYFVSTMTANFIAFYPAIGAMTLAMSLHIKKLDSFNIVKTMNQIFWLPLIFLLVAFGFHKASVLGLLFYALALIGNYRPSLIIPIYGLTFLFDNQRWLDILQLASLYIDFGSDSAFSNYANYINNADHFYTMDGNEIKDYGRSLFTYIRLFVANSLAVFLFYHWRIENGVNNLKCKILELSSIALILMNVTAGVALFSRFALMMEVFLPILYAYAVNYGLKSRLSKYRIFAWIIILVLGYEYAADLYFLDVSDYKYIWNK